MEQLNRIELRGRIGMVRTSEVGNRQVCHFSVATNSIYKGQDNQVVEETTWHNCTLWSSKKFPDLSIIKTGLPVEVTGRMKSNRYNLSDGTERTSYEVLANEFRILPENEQLKAENKS